MLIVNLIEHQVFFSFFFEANHVFHSCKQKHITTHAVTLWKIPEGHVTRNNYTKDPEQKYAKKPLKDLLCALLYRSARSIRQPLTHRRAQSSRRRGATRSTAGRPVASVVSLLSRERGKRRERRSFPLINS
jgi:hypothetical protein